MSLIAAGLHDHPVVHAGIDFLIRSVRPDGSWPIDTNLSTWVTTLSINALSSSGMGAPPMLFKDTGEAPVPQLFARSAVSRIRLGLRFFYRRRCTAHG